MAHPLTSATQLLRGIKNSLIRSREEMSNQVSIVGPPQSQLNPNMEEDANEQQTGIKSADRKKGVIWLMRRARLLNFDNGTNDTRTNIDK